jgi:hypothetical protein
MPPGLAMKQTELVFAISNDLAMIGRFEGKEGELNVGDLQISLVNGVIIEHMNRQIYVRDNEFLYQFDPNGQPLPGKGLLEDIIKHAEMKSSA